MPNASKKPCRISYPLEQSPLYKLHNKRKLSSLLGLPYKELMHIIGRADNYRVFDIVQENGKKRRVEWPKPYLERIHYRLFELLSRIEVPDYLHSGVKGRSYVSNATVHVGTKRLATLDIKSFYPSTSKSYVFRFFCEYLKCSPDVAHLVADVITFEGHLPTGSCLSQIAAFFAHKELFNKLNEISASNSVDMTCYVDDLTFSGDGVNGEFLFEIKKEIHNWGMTYHKEKYYPDPTGDKKVTGVIVGPAGMKVPNRLQKAVHEGIAKLRDAGATESEISSLMGKCNAAQLLEKRFTPASREAAAYLRRSRIHSK